MSYPYGLAAGKMLNDEIDAELSRAWKKFPNNAHLMVALTEEVGELAEALLNTDHPAIAAAHPEIVAVKGVDALRRRVREEAIQVICVAIRIIHEGDGDFPNSSHVFTPKEG